MSLDHLAAILDECLSALWASGSDPECSYVPCSGGKVWHAVVASETTLGRLSIISRPHLVGLVVVKSIISETTLDRPSCKSIAIPMS